MIIFSEDAPAPAALRGAAAVLGNFDGVHKGHQGVIEAAARTAHARGLRLAAAVFEPHPRQILRPDDPPFRLQSPGQRARALAAAGIEIVFQLRFDRALASCTDEDFARVVLHERLGLAHVQIGFDFTYGRARMGNAQSLLRQGSAYEFTVDVVEPISDGGPAKYSSSAVRAAIAAGRMEDAAAILGRAWAIEGPVLPGAALGRTLGFPTANVGLGAYVRPRFGVYAARVRLDDATMYAAVASCGVRPTISPSGAPLLEAFLFDFNGDLYGRRLEIELIAFLRPEMKFETIEAMKAQMAVDAAQARAALAP